MAAIVDESYLDERLGKLENAAAWSPRTISKFETFLRNADDAQLFKIDPLEFARDKGIRERESIDLFLHATRLGITDIQWGLVCPSCGDTVESFATLRQVDSHFNCTICEQETTAALDDFIMISFMISRRVRPIVFHDPATLQPGDYWQTYRFNRQWRYAGVGPITRVFFNALQSVQAVPAGESVDVDLQLSPGFLKIFNTGNETLFSLPVKASGDGPQAVQVSLDGTSTTASAVQLDAGPVKLSIANRTAAPFQAAVFWLGVDPLTLTVEIDPFFTAKQLLNSQTFRNLFSSEVILATEGIGIRDITLLFTDLKGSTAMYDRIGDLQAFSLVRQHFESLTKVVVQNRGAIVKTIGDAVMATFLTPLDGINAALQMLREIESFNSARGSADLILKVGLHHGAAIAVTLNDRLDYFGQTVNIAARVQGLADEDEIYITREVQSAPGVTEALAGFEVVAEQSRLKGIAEAVSVFRVAVPSGRG